MRWHISTWLSPWFSNAMCPKLLNNFEETLKLQPQNKLAADYLQKLRARAAP
jgi:hypothetical protein